MKSTVEEIFLIRAIACLCVVLIHALTVVVWNFPPASEQIRSIMMSGQLLLMFATPIFVFISEFILAYNYKTAVPRGFFGKRLRFIFIPFVVMAVFYAWLSASPDGMAAVWERIGENLFLARYHGYFILIIFQFYLLHALFARFLARLSPVPVITVSLFINASYLSFFHFTVPALPADLWRFLYWIPFPGWLVYFVIGYYAGLYFEEFQQKVKRFKSWILLSWPVTASIVLFVHQSGLITEISSKRIDVMVLTISTILLLFLAAFYVKRVPGWIIFISQYSFGIYLLHPFAQKVIQWLVKPFDWSGHPAALTVLLWTGGTLISIALTGILNRLPLGAFIVGKINKPKTKSAA
ncbi:acyltransferase family protein [Domibacillus indicus]|uniref:acyltransferase family protein n=1 Tax=Domibacillus indicus TaxID=1437523 RepID=UPI000617BA5E|nr:acyltransferase family protein [Domibacillus indicus]